MSTKQCIDLGWEKAVGPGGGNKKHLRFFAFVLLAFFLALLSSRPASAQAGSDAETEKIRTLIKEYEKSVSDADTKLASEIWDQREDVSFIHPLGHEHGWDEIKSHVYEKLMGETFSERKLVVRDVSVHVYKDAAWVEFYWTFDAKFRSNGSPVRTEGRETQVYHKTRQGWRLVHVHYSVMPPPAPKTEGF